MRVGKLRGFLAAGALLAIPAFAYASGRSAEQSGSMEQKVRHELNMLPYYGVFDNLSFRVDGGKVTLFGQVARPVLKLDAENAVKHIEGVKQVDDQIEVLPLSSFDNDIRLRAYRAIYGFGPLNRYAMGTHPSIHILVKNGNVTLAGVVANSMDRNLAYVRANGVPGAFSVTNELRVEHN
ncbi:MAG: transport-associated protein [Bryobacterales bacterium]|jgi:hyperosmotically inducible protein|nr:transport-associated protein [Bryobacterales bacterium]